MKRRSFLYAMAAAPLFGGRDVSEFPDWSAEEIDRILTKSAWAHEWKKTIEIPARSQMMGQSFQMGGQLPFPSRIPGIGGAGWPGGGRGTSRGPTGGTGRGSQTADLYHMEVRMIIRWASALPMRRAMALHEFGKDGLKEDKAVAMLQQEPKEYVIELTGIPRDITGGDAEGIEKALQRTAAIAVKGHRTLHPMSVSVPSPGVSITAAMHFQRWANVSAGDGAVEFTADLGRTHIKETFSLRAMQYEGQIQL